MSVQGYSNRSMQGLVRPSESEQCSVSLTGLVASLDCPGRALHHLVECPACHNPMLANADVGVT